MTSLAEVRSALGAALESIEGLEVHDRLGGPYNPPCAVVVLDDILAYYDSFSDAGAISLNFLIYVLVGRADDAIAETNLDDYSDWTGDLSVPRALTKDQSLGGLTGSVWLGPPLAPGPASRRTSPEEVAGLDAYGRVFSANVQLSKER